LSSLRADSIVNQDEQLAEVQLRNEQGAWGVRSCVPGQCLPTVGLLPEDLPLALACPGTDLA
jgi:hypothetical protein